MDEAPGAIPSIAEPWERHWRKVLGAKVIGVLAASLVTLLVVQDRSTRVLFVVLALGVYLPLSLVLYSVQRRAPKPPNPIWFGITLLDISLIGAAQALFPRLSVAFLGLTPIVVLAALLLSREWALVVALVSWAALLGGVLFGTGPQPSEFSAVVGGILLIGMAYLIGSLAEEERRAANRSRRLGQAIGSVVSSLDLAAVLESLSEVARDALNGLFALVLLGDGDSLEFGGGSRHPAASIVSTKLAQILEDPLAQVSPTVQAMRTMRPVMVSDIASDPRMARWRGLAGKLGFRSVVSVPILRRGKAIGALNVYLSRPQVFRPEEFEFLGALAEHAGLAVERARLFAREKQTVTRLLELDRMKSEFVATVSHELRTPLTAIEGFALTLRNKWREFPPELRDEMLERLDDNARSLDHLITHLLDFGRLERGEFRIEARDHAVDELIGRVLQNMVHELADHPVTTDLTPGVRVMTDQYAFDRILGNLFSNAAKFSDPGTPIEVHSWREGSDVLITVRDHGPGIPEDHLDRVFERFYRGSQSSRGTGIGLAVVEDLVGLHGGRVHVRNASPGTKFVVHLPAAPQVAVTQPSPGAAAAQA